MTVHWIDEGIDTGDIVLQERIELAAAESERSLAARSAPVAARLLVEALRQVEAGTAPRIPQSEEGASYYSQPPRGASTALWGTMPARARQGFSGSPQTCGGVATA